MDGPIMAEPESISRSSIKQPAKSGATLRPHDVGEEINYLHDEGSQENPRSGRGKKPKKAKRALKAEAPVVIIPEYSPEIAMPPGCWGSSLQPCDLCGAKWSARERREVEGEQVPIHFRSFVAEHWVFQRFTFYVDPETGRETGDVWPVLPNRCTFWCCEECYATHAPDQFQTAGETVRHKLRKFEWTPPIEEDDPAPFVMTPQEYIAYTGNLPPKVRLLPEDDEALLREIQTGAGLARDNQTY